MLRTKAVSPVLVPAVRAPPGEPCLQAGLPRLTWLESVRAPVAAPAAAPIAAPPSGPIGVTAPMTAPLAAPMAAPLPARSPVVSPQAASASGRLRAAMARERPRVMGASGTTKEDR